MPKLKPETQQARRDRILDAAEVCFAQAGLHRTTMQDICNAADVSPGALYVYFDSKEGLIAGLCERERNKFLTKIARLAAAPDFLEELEKIAHDYFVDESAQKRLVSVEMAVEATRNPAIASICHEMEATVTGSFRDMFQRLKDADRIAPNLSIEDVTQVFMLMGDGLFWRRAVLPHFDATKVLPAVLVTLENLLKPVGAATSTAKTARPSDPPRARKPMYRSTNTRKIKEVAP